MRREMLIGRISDIVTRSKVDDAQEILRELERQVPLVERVGDVTYVRGQVVHEARGVGVPLMAEQLAVALLDALPIGRIHTLDAELTTDKARHDGIELTIRARRNFLIRPSDAARFLGGPHSGFRQIAVVTTRADGLIDARNLGTTLFIPFVEGALLHNSRATSYINSLPNLRESKAPLVVVIQGARPPDIYPREDMIE